MVAVHVAQLLKAPPGATRSIDFDEIVDGAESTIVFRGPVSGSAKLTRTSDGILVHCRFATSVELECGRCLEKYTTPVEGEFEEEYLPVTNIYTGVAIDTPAGEDEPRIGADHVLSLDDLIRQYTSLEMPMLPLCSPDCAGLCTYCGADLNQGPCGCDAEAEQPMGRLGELLKQQLGR
jgi:uncharacterized protein